jgi:large conductance mechanosensitive channel
MSLASEFKSFISRGNVVDLAVGIIMGAAFTAIVTSLVSDVIMPPVGWLMGGLDFSNLFIALPDKLAIPGVGDAAAAKTYNTLKAAQEAGVVTINYGIFLNAIIKFMIVSWAVFWLVKLVNKVKKAEEAKPAPGPSAQEVLLTEIRDLLKK